jgi:hypothetical protein
MHRRTAVENNLAEFVDNVVHPGVAAQAQSWGCADAEVEDIRLEEAGGSEYMGGLRAAITTPMGQVSEFAYVRETYDRVGYEAGHILPYLTDVLASAPRSWNVAWFGINKSMFDLFRAAWPKMGFKGRIFAARKDDASANAGDGPVVEADLTEALSRADVFIFDFALPDGKAIDTSQDAGNQQLRYLQRCFLAVVKAEQDIGSKRFPRRVIAINAIHNRFESLVRGHIEYARSPFSGRLRHGYVLPAPKEVTSWLGQMTLRGAGRWKGREIRADQMRRGQVISGPHMSLLPGQYTVALEIEPKFPRFPMGWFKFLFVTFFGGRLTRRKTNPSMPPQSQARLETLEPGAQNVRVPTRWRKSGVVAVEIRNGDEVLSQHSLSVSDLWLKRKHKHYFELPVTHDDLESATLPSVNVRVWTSGRLGLRINGLDLISGGPA